MKKYMILLSFSLAFGDNMIFVESPKDTLNQIITTKDDTNATLSLAPNQTLVINHTDNTMLYILEITQDGGVKKIKLPKEFVGKKMQSTPMIFSDDYGKKDTKITQSTSSTNTDKTQANKTNKFKDREWNKGRIIYEQKVEILKVK